MIRTLAVASVLLLGAGAVVAQQDKMKEAQTEMKGNGKALGGTLGPMAKGEKPYDQAAVDAALKNLDDTAKKLPTLFPDSLKGAKADGDYSPSPKIWEDKAGFAEKIDAFAKVVADAKSKIKDAETLKASFPAIGKSCGGCHETYRIKNS